MEINAQITILINRDYTTIELFDKDASTTIVEIKLTPEQLSSALSRLSHTDCKAELHNIERAGKKHECKSFEFEISKSLRGSQHAEELSNLAQSHLSDGWLAESYFASQNSFFERDGKQYARCTIRRWI